MISQTRWCSRAIDAADVTPAAAAPAPGLRALLGFWSCNVVYAFAGHIWRSFQDVVWRKRGCESKVSKRIAQKKTPLFLRFLCSHRNSSSPARRGATGERTMPEPPAPAKLRRPSALLFGSALFLSAFLLFWVQPLVGRLLLPMLGGTPAVWNTCLVFFQAVLLAGYLYVDLGRGLGPRRQAFVLLGVGLFAALLLPVALPAWPPPQGGDPTLWLIAALAAMVGLPRWSTAAPLVQSWYGLESRPGTRPVFSLRHQQRGRPWGMALIHWPLNPTRRCNRRPRWSSGFITLLALLALTASPPVASTRRHGSSSGRRRRLALGCPRLAVGLAHRRDAITTDVASARCSG